jgi:hypothetical protein
MSIHREDKFLALIREYHMPEQQRCAPLILWRTADLVALTSCVDAELQNRAPGPKPPVERGSCLYSEEFPC